MKKTIRIIIALISFIPSIPILWLIFGFFGVILLFIPIGYLIKFYSWVIDEEYLRGGAIETLEIGWECFCCPYYFWRDFIQGKNPMDCLG